MLRFCVSDGPLLVASAVQVTLAPAITGSGESVSVTAISVDAVSVSVSVALLLPGVGSVAPAGTAMVAVLTSDPVADAAIVQVAV